MTQQLGRSTVVHGNLDWRGLFVKEPGTWVPCSFSFHWTGTQTFRSVIPGVEHKTNKKRGHMQWYNIHHGETKLLFWCQGVQWCFEQEPLGVLIFGLHHWLQEGQQVCLLHEDKLHSSNLTASRFDPQNIFGLAMQRRSTSERSVTLTRSLLHLYFLRVCAGGRPRSSKTSRMRSKAASFYIRIR